MFCSNCGAAVADGMEFCPECGEKTKAAKRLYFAGTVARKSPKMR